MKTAQENMDMTFAHRCLVHCADAYRELRRHKPGGKLFTARRKAELLSRQRDHIIRLARGDSPWGPVR